MRIRLTTIALASVVAGAAALVGSLTADLYWVILGVAFLVGGTANPLYALLLAYVNDYLDTERMAGASGALIFVNGIGAITGPLVIGWLMAQMGPRGFWLFVAILMLGLAAYAVWRMGRRPAAVPVEETGSYAPITPVSSPVATQLAQEYYADTHDENVSENATNETSRDPES